VNIPATSAVTHAALPADPRPPAAPARASAPAHAGPPAGRAPGARNRRTKRLAPEPNGLRGGGGRGGGGRLRPEAPREPPRERPGAPGRALPRPSRRRSARRAPRGSGRRAPGASRWAARTRGRAAAAPAPARAGRVGAGGVFGRRSAGFGRRWTERVSGMRRCTPSSTTSCGRAARAPQRACGGRTQQQRRRQRAGGARGRRRTAHLAEQRGAHERRGLPDGVACGVSD